MPSENDGVAQFVVHRGNSAGLPPLLNYGYKPCVPSEYPNWHTGQSLPIVTPMFPGMSREACIVAAVLHGQFLVP